MSSISDFFTLSSGSSTTTVTTPRVTHGTTCQKYTVSCCNACCTCIPATATAWAYEMIGQGAGGGGACCCMYSPWGGRGGYYGAARLSPGTGSLGLCYCACVCWCCAVDASGHCGQFMRMCACGNLSSTGTAWCAMVGGGCCYGCTCCNYGCQYVCPCRLDQAVSTHVADGLPCGGVSTAVASSNDNGLAGVLNCTQTTNSNGNVSETDYFLSSFIGSITIGGATATPAIGGTNLCDSAGSIFSKNGDNCFCHPGNSKSHNFQCNVTECFSFDGSEGWSIGSNSCWNTVCGNYGVGGATYAGAANQTCVGIVSTYYWYGCGGLFPGGGGSSAGMCPGNCCPGGRGGSGVIAVSYDN